jgi:hypothetical protein
LASGGGKRFSDRHLNTFVPDVVRRRVIDNDSFVRWNCQRDADLEAGAVTMFMARCDHSHGGFLNADLGEYVLPVNADIGSIDVEFIDEPDFQFNCAGAKGLGEVSLTGVAPAIANAVFHVVASNAISGALSVFPNRAGAAAALAGALQFGAGALNDRGR